MTTEIIKTLVKLEKAVAKANKALSDYRISIKEECTHPESHTYRTYRDCDDGYGRWWKHYYFVCKICGKHKSEYNDYWYNEE